MRQRAGRNLVRASHVGRRDVSNALKQNIEFCGGSNKRGMDCHNNPVSGWATMETGRLVGCHPNPHQSFSLGALL